MNGRFVTKTFDTAKEAGDWVARTSALIRGGEWQDRSQAQRTSLREACDWYIDRVAPMGPDGKRRFPTANAKNAVAKARYWQTTEFADWSILSLHPADLLEWRRNVLDEDNIEDDAVDRGPQSEVGAQTVIHRLNTLSQIYKRWAMAHRLALENPVTAGVRPAKPGGRDRRLEQVTGEERRLLKAAEKSTRPWLKYAIVVALETAMRQTELAELEWRRVKLTAAHPHVDLLKTKNDRPRRVPLSKRAVAAFKALRRLADAEYKEASTRAAQKGRPAPDQRERVLPVETGRGLAHAFRDAIGDSEFPDLRWHDLRHEAISRLFELTDLRDHEIMAISGHLSPAMLARYTHLRADRLGDRLPGGRLNPNNGVERRR